MATRGYIFRPRVGFRSRVTDQVFDTTQTLANGVHDLEHEWAIVHGLVVPVRVWVGEGGELGLGFVKSGAVHRVSSNTQSEGNCREHLIEIREVIDEWLWRVGLIVTNCRVRSV